MVWIVLFFTILCVNIPFADRITEMQKDTPWIGIIYGVFFFGFLILNLILLLLMTHRRLRSFGLQCPACEKTLHGQLLPHVITSGRCPPTAAT